jgi:hypothetical protein
LQQRLNHGSRQHFGLQQRLARWQRPQPSSQPHDGSQPQAGSWPQLGATGAAQVGSTAAQVGSAGAAQLGSAWQQLGASQHFGLQQRWNHCFRHFGWQQVGSQQEGPASQPQPPPSNVNAEALPANTNIPATSAAAIKIRFFMGRVPLSTCLNGDECWPAAR